ncbi:MAG: hypothetical protein QM674_20175 [Burkholderiaceae bacterium]
MVERGPDAQRFEQVAAARGQRENPGVPVVGGVAGPGGRIGGAAPTPVAGAAADGAMIAVRQPAWAEASAIAAPTAPMPTTATSNTPSARAAPGP